MRLNVCPPLPYIELALWHFKMESTEGHHGKFQVKVKVKVKNLIIEFN